MKFIVTAVFLTFSILGFSRQADLQPLSGPQSSAFKLNSDKRGDLTGSVNLFSGDVNFPVQLAALSGRNGLDASVAITYSSNVQSLVKKWNLDAPTGVAGLGWSFDYPKIVVDNKMTGTREDDAYYVIESGSSNRLVFKGGTVASGKVYEAKNYQFWSITFFPNEEKWEIIKEDGTKYTYGDKNSARSTVQWVVTWNNWIGSSSVTTSTVQKQQALEWNLSEIKNIWGDKITFAYLNDNQKVGSASGKEHTEASYLSTITDVFGRTINLVYALKGAGEFVEPHAENGVNAIDAYQERFEKRYLDYVEIRDEAGALMSKSDLSYSTIGIGDLTKRLLTSVIQFNPANQSLPGYKFDYYTNTSQFNYGNLYKVTLPTGGTIIYEYQEKEIVRSVRDKKVVAISGYAEPKVWIGPDYVIVTRRQLTSGGNHTTSDRNVKLQVFTWDGEWIEWNLNEILTNIRIVDNNGDDDAANLTDEDDPDYYKFWVTQQKDFFALAYRDEVNNNNKINIYRKDEKVRGGWLKNQFTESTSNAWLHKNYRLVSGENFVCFAYSAGDLNLFTWNGSNWIQSSITRTNSTHNPIVAGHNYIISHYRAPTGFNSDIIKFYFLKEDRTWTTVTAPSMSDNSTQDKSYWYPSNSFAVVMADDNNEQFYVWDENYVISRTSTSLALNDKSFVDIIDGSMVGILDPFGSSTNGYAFRYNGESWIASGTIDYEAGLNVKVRPQQSYGSDFLIRPRPGTPQVVGLKVFNPNTGIWSSSDIATANRNISFSGADFFVTVDATNSNNARLYYRNRNAAASFTSDPFSFPTFYFGGSDPDNINFQWQGGFDYVVRCWRRGSISSLKFNNGKIDPVWPSFNNHYSEPVDHTVFPPVDIDHWAEDDYPAIYEYEMLDPTIVQATGNTLVTFISPVTSDTWLQRDAQEVRLHRVINSEIVGYQKDCSVYKITFDDGENLITNRIQYVETQEDIYQAAHPGSNIVNFVSTATCDASGLNTQYNRVRVYPKYDLLNPLSSGYTEYQFHNGLTNAQATAGGAAFPSSLSITGISSDHDLFNMMLKGSPYRTRIFDATGSIVSQNETTYKLYQKDITQSSVVVDKGWYVRNYTEAVTVDNKVTKSYQVINEINGLPSQSSTFSSGSDNVGAMIQYYKYWYEAYDPMLSKRILSPVIQTRSYLNGVPLSTEAIKYKDWGANNTPAPYQVYSWIRTGSGDFTSWPLVSTPSADWRLVSTVDVIDATKGLATQTSSPDGVVSKIVYDINGKNVLARITAQSPIGYVYYNGFEDCGSCLTVDAAIGLKSSASNVTISTMPMGTYKLTYWTKQLPTGPWQLVESTFTGTSVTVPAPCDDIRIFSSDSGTQITSYGYNKFGNTITESDANNIAVFNEYDEFQRPKLIRDKDRNIIRAMTYKNKE